MEYKRKPVHLSDAGFWHVKHVPVDVGETEVFEKLAVAFTLLSAMPTRLRTSTAVQLAGIYDFREAKFSTHRNVLRECDLDSVAKRKKSTLLKRAWSTGILEVRPEHRDHRFDLWPRIPGGGRIPPPRLSKRSLDALVDLARKASWRVCTSWGTHVDAFFRRPPVEVIPRLHRRIRVENRKTSTKFEQVGLALGLTTLGSTYKPCVGVIGTSTGLREHN
jgi:hypothetical protein